mgnify:CR=1 FL=1
MIRLVTFFLIAMPLFAAAQETELQTLRQELEELKQINALYVEKIHAMERRLQALEKGGPTEPGEAPEAVTHVAETTADAVVGDTSQLHDTGFDPRRFDYYG